MELSQLSQHIIAYPISGGELVNIVAFVTEAECGTPYHDKNDPSRRKWVRDVTMEEVVKAYEGWEEEVSTLLGVRLFIFWGTYRSI